MYQPDKPLKSCVHINLYSKDKTSIKPKICTCIMYSNVIVSCDGVTNPFSELEAKLANNNDERTALLERWIFTQHTSLNNWASTVFSGLVLAGVLRARRKLRSSVRPTRRCVARWTTQSLRCRSSEGRTNHCRCARICLKTRSGFLDSVNLYIFRFLPTKP